MGKLSRAGRKHLSAEAPWPAHQRHVMACFAPAGAARPLTWRPAAACSWQMLEAHAPTVYFLSRRTSALHCWLALNRQSMQCCALPEASCFPLWLPTLQPSERAQMLSAAMLCLLNHHRSACLPAALSRLYQPCRLDSHARLTVEFHQELCCLPEFLSFHCLHLLINSHNSQPRRF